MVAFIRAPSSKINQWLLPNADKMSLGFMATSSGGHCSTAISRALQLAQTQLNFHCHHLTPSQVCVQFEAMDHHADMPPLCRFLIPIGQSISQPIPIWCGMGRLGGGHAGGEA